MMSVLEVTTLRARIAEAVALRDKLQAQHDRANDRYVALARQRFQMEYGFEFKAATPDESRAFRELDRRVKSAQAIAETKFRLYRDAVHLLTVLRANLGAS